MIKSLVALSMLTWLVTKCYSYANFPRPFEPRHEKTCLRVPKLVRADSSCPNTEDGSLEA